jgi:hypothetical protein
MLLWEHRHRSDKNVVSKETLTHPSGVQTAANKLQWTYLGVCGLFVAAEWVQVGLLKIFHGSDQVRLRIMDHIRTHSSR